VFAEVNETRFAKLSFAGVVGFDVEFEAYPLSGVVLPDTGGVGRRPVKVYEAFATAAFLSPGAAVQSSPERSFMLQSVLPCSGTKATALRTEVLARCKHVV